MCISNHEHLQVLITNLQMYQKRIFVDNKKRSPLQSVLEESCNSARPVKTRLGMFKKNIQMF